MSSIAKLLAKTFGKTMIVLRAGIAARSQRFTRNALNTSLHSKRVVATNITRSFSAESAQPVQPAQCPFKSIADLPGEWEDIPWGGDHSYQYNPSGMYKYSLFGDKTLNIYSAEAAKDVFKLDGPGKAHSNWSPQIKALLGASSMTLKYGKDHSRIRRVLNPLFTDKAIRNRYGSVWNATDKFLNALFTKTGECKEGEYVHLYPMTRRWAWDIAISVVLGVGDVVTKEENDRMCTIFNDWSLGMFDPDFSNVDKPGTLLGDGMIARLIPFCDQEGITGIYRFHHRERKSYGR